MGVRVWNGGGTGWDVYAKDVSARTCCDGMALVVLLRMTVPTSCGHGASFW
jgi:hypothetical protein